MTKYPLSWPTGWKRTEPGRRAKGKFLTYKKELSIAQGCGRVLSELGRLGINADEDIIISTNVEVNIHGLPRSDRAAPADPGVAVYWQDRHGKRQSMAIDRYTKVADNLAAIAATLEAFRAIERHGGAEIIERAFLGFTALPAPKPWREVLNMVGSSNLALAKKHYQELAMIHHPDQGGNAEAMAEINRAWSDAQRELGT